MKDIKGGVWEEKKKRRRKRVLERNRFGEVEKKS